ncbi:hypothetical protein BU17DRAFT_58549 [Hysterangium stoloniferum]|nr:hypothetical protein BU17DRAFT_58549 [Hysterangium stoloniferum]
MEIAKNLISRKDAIQAELDSQYSILSANSSTLHTPLVDPQGFPRSDIDVYAVRHARVRIIELKNDMDAIINELGKALETVYNPQSGVTDTSAAQGSPGETTAFAKVDGVAPSSPAAQAVSGLLREDFIVQFGSLTSSAFSSRSLQPLADLVAAHENQTINIIVLRKETQRHSLQLIPRQGWGGRGLLGYAIVMFF